MFSVKGNYIAYSLLVFLVCFSGCFFKNIWLLVFLIWVVGEMPQQLIDGQKTRWRDSKLQAGSWTAGNSNRGQMEKLTEEVIMPA